MRRPIFVRALSDEEREALVAGLRSPDAFVLRRCQILLASARGKIAREIASDLGCAGQTVRTAIAAFNAKGVACLAHWSSRPRTTHPAFNAEQAARLKALLHQSPRTFGKPTSVWTLPLAAEVSFEQGLTHERVSGETIRATLVRLDVRWKRVKEWHPEGTRSPDPASARKKTCYALSRADRASSSGDWLTDRITKGRCSFKTTSMRLRRR
jgi:transposase